MRGEVQHILMHWAVVQHQHRPKVRVSHKLWSHGLYHSCTSHYSVCGKKSHLTTRAVHLTSHAATGALYDRAAAVWEALLLHKITSLLHNSVTEPSLSSLITGSIGLYLRQVWKNTITEIAPFFKRTQLLEAALPTD